jgi:aminoglycoside 3-N-acetyltransferase
MLHPGADLATPGPYRPADLATDLARLGLERGDVVMVHASISSIGWVAGGGVGLLLALREVIGTAGTVVVPTFTTYLSDPNTWVRRPVPHEWWDVVRDSLPVFDPALHAAQPGLGRFPELVRAAGALRSAHPLFSLAAIGPHATDVIGTHELAFGLGRRSPLSGFTAVGGKVLLIGVGWDKCTLLHLCEHETPYPGRRKYIARVPVSHVDGRTRWRDTEQLVMYEGDFAAIGNAATADGLAGHGRIGNAPARLAPAKSLVEHGNHHMAKRDLRAAAAPPYLRGVTPAANEPL